MRGMVCCLHTIGGGVLPQQLRLEEWSPPLAEHPQGASQGDHQRWSLGQGDLDGNTPHCLTVQPEQVPCRLWALLSHLDIKHFHPQIRFLNARINKCQSRLFIFS